MDSHATGTIPKLEMVNSVEAFGLPIDPNPKNELKQVRGFNYSRVTPTPLENVRIGSLSKDCMKWIGLGQVSEDTKNTALAELLCGNKLFEGSKPISHCYCGHQFGVFAGQLGDGRAISLGDVAAVNEEQDIEKYGQKKWDIVDLQIKGGGLTPYSRRADGRAVLRSSIREYLCSEAMWSLGIPTTRAASLVVSETTVQRDKLYTGNVINERCAVVLRVAPTFIRFGSFEIFKPTDSYSGGKGPSQGLKDQMLPRMLDYLLENFYKEIGEQAEPDGEGASKANGGLQEFAENVQKRFIPFNQAKLDPETRKKYQTMFTTIVKDTAELAAKWQCHGFCHGVLNTDNMSVLGLTIDYGPFGWMEHFDPDYICNHSDNDRGRYKYKAQPEICKWNLYKLCEALEPIVDLEYSTDYVRAHYDTYFEAAYMEKLAQKVGFFITQPPSVGGKAGVDLGTHLLRIDPDQTFRKLTKEEQECIEKLLEAMIATGSDFTDTFRILADVSPGLKEGDEKFQEALGKLVQICAPLALLDKKDAPRYSARELAQLEQILKVQPQMLALLGVDPEEAKAEIEKAKNAKNACKFDPDRAKKAEENKVKNTKTWTTWLVQYVDVLGQCEEIKQYDSLEAYDAARRDSMNGRVNPAYILRNYLLEDAIKKAEATEDFSEVDSMLQRVLNPFDDVTVPATIVDRPESRFGICVSCSS